MILTKEMYYDFNKWISSGNDGDGTYLIASVFFVGIVALVYIHTAII